MAAALAITATALLLALWASGAPPLAAAAGPRQRSTQPRPGLAENPLELWNVAGVRLTLAAPAADGGAAARGPAIRANASSFAGSHAWVTVSWSGLGKGAFDDYVAVYTSGADPTAVAPIKYQWAAKAPSHMRLGAGSLRFRVLNMRHDLRFALIRNGLQLPTVVAWSEPLLVASPNEPMQGHLSLTGRQGEVMTQWVTRDRGSPAVRWGTASGTLEHTAPGDSITYTREDMCGAPANATGWNVDPGWLHAVVMGGLQPSTRYFYSYGEEALGWSAEESFISPPAVGPDTSVTLLAVADLGQAELDGSMEASEMIPSLATTARLAAEVDAGAQLLIHNGDISYARGFASIWPAFFDQLGPVLRRVPWVTTVGNHERDWPGSGDRFPAVIDSGGECGVPYMRYTRMPGPEGGPPSVGSGAGSGRGEGRVAGDIADKPWFSLDFGPVHLLQFSTEHLFEPGSEQYAWIEGDLAAVDRSRTPWLVVGGHRPIYIDSTWWSPDQPDSDQHMATALRAALEPLFLKYQVDVTWSGHHHSYQRTCPVHSERCVGWDADGAAKGPVHLIIGHAGAGITPNVHFLRPKVFESIKLQHGYMKVEANATHMVHRVLSSFDSSLLDELILTKPPDCRSGWGRAPPACAAAQQQQQAALEGPGAGAGGAAATA